jgi:hypothetical protein
MKAKEKTKIKRRRKADENNPFWEKVEESDMTDIDRKINALLSAEGYAIEEATRSERTGWNNDLNANHITYARHWRSTATICGT